MLLETRDEKLIVGVSSRHQLISPPSYIAISIKKPDRTLRMCPAPRSFQQRLYRRVIAIRQMKVICDDENHSPASKISTGGFRSFTT